MMIREATETAADAGLENAESGQRRRPMPRSQRILLRLVALLAGFAVAVLLIFVFLRDTTPEVTRAKLAEAVARWQQTGPASYDVSVNTSRNDHFEIEVRDGEVTAMKRNGNRYAEDRLTDTWLVESQFEYIEEDLDSADLPKNRDGMRLVGLFDAKFGYPLRYRCMTSDSRPETGWEVTYFRIIKP